MHSANVPETMRRSSRVPITLPIAVTSLEPSAPFSEICETLVVSAHGCAIFSPTRLEAGIPVQFRRKGGGAAKAHVVDCKPMGAGQQGWQLAATLDQPENFWGLESCPEDWGRLLEIHSDDPQPARKMPAEATKPNPARPRLKIVSEKGHAQFTEYDLRAIVAEFVQPLHAEVVALKEKAAQGDAQAQPLRHFAVAHSSRGGREIVGPSARRPGDASAEADPGAIGAGAGIGPDDDRAEHQPGAGRIPAAGGTATANRPAECARVVRRNRRGGGPALQFRTRRNFRSRWRKREPGQASKGEEHFRSLQKRLGEEHDAYRGEMQKAQDTVSAETSRLQTQATSLGGRMAQLDDTACRLESGMETRLSQMASDQISAARVQLESAVDVVLKELGTRNAKELDRQLDDARGKLKIVQKGIETSVSDLVKTEVAASLLSFGQTMEELAQDSVGRWRRR